MPSYTVPYIPNLKEIALAVPEIQVSETHWNFSYFSSSLHQTIMTCTNYVLVHQFQQNLLYTQAALPKLCISITFGYDLQ